MVNKGSLVFSDSDYKVIFVDCNFNPIDDESRLFCKFYSASYKDCKNRFSNCPSTYYKRTVGKNSYVTFIVLNSKKFIEIGSLNDFISNEIQGKGNRNVSILMSKDLDYSRKLINTALGDRVTYFYKTLA